MNRSALFFALAASVAAAQTAPKHTTTTAPHHTAGTAAAASSAGAAKLPPGVPPVHTPLKTAFTMRYQEIKIGTGPEAQSNKLYKVFYTGYLAATGVKFDSSDDHRQPVTDKDGKPELGPDGKPKLGDPQPLVFPQGMGRLIPGFDQGFHGMHIGGKRRLFIPWQLAYGTHEIPGRGTEHPGIPAMSDLIFDVELAGVEELPAPMQRPMGGAPAARPSAPPNPGAGEAAPDTAKPAAPDTAKPATPDTAPSTPPPADSQPAQPSTPPKPE